MKPQNKKRFGAAVLLLILLLVLSACSRGQSESSPPESSSPVSTEQEETAQPETEQPETPDVTANEAVLYIGTRDGGFTGEGGDPDALDIYYYMEGERPLELPDIGREWPLDQPYAW